MVIVEYKKNKKGYNDIYKKHALTFYTLILITSKTIGKHAKNGNKHA